MTENIICIKNLTIVIKKQILHDDLNLEIKKGEILGIVGGSGTGKTVLLRTILGLMHQHSGSIEIFGIDSRDSHKNLELQRRWGVLFQSGALFSSLTTLENIQIPMIELANLPKDIAEELAEYKLSQVGLPKNAGDKLPSELSGGMVKRAGLARALAIDAELLLLDEPTAGLDPISAESFDQLIKQLQKNLGLTVVMVTHDLDSLVTLCDRIAVLVDKKMITGTIEELHKNPHPWIQNYFNGKRGRAVPGKDE